jgi:hypothetical protein
MNERGAPTPVAWTRLRAPESLMAPADPAAMTAAVSASTLASKYGEAIDRESAREKLAARLEAGAAEARREPAGKADDERIDYPSERTAGRGRTKKPTRSGEDTVADIMRSPVARDLMRTAAREIVRGVFRVGRRR